jgi:hypothetical protein
MGRFVNHNGADRGIAFGSPYSHRPPISWHYTLAYRGYELDVARHLSVWQVGIHPRHPDLPLLRHCQVRGHSEEEAVIAAKQRVDAALCPS